MLRRARDGRIYSKFEPAVIWWYIWLLHNLGSSRWRCPDTMSSSGRALVGAPRGAGERAASFLTVPSARCLLPTFTRCPCLLRMKHLAQVPQVGHAAAVTLCLQPGGAACRLSSSGCPGSASPPPPAAEAPLLLKMPFLQAFVGSWLNRRLHNPQDLMAFMT